MSQFSPHLNTFIVITNKVINIFLKLQLKSKNSIKKSGFEKRSDLILSHTTIKFLSATSIEKWSILCAYNVEEFDD